MNRNMNENLFLCNYELLSGFVFLKVSFTYLFITQFFLTLFPFRHLSILFQSKTFYILPKLIEIRNNYPLQTFKTNVLG